MSPPLYRQAEPVRLRIGQRIPPAACIAAAVMCPGTIQHAIDSEHKVAIKRILDRAEHEGWPRESRADAIRRFMEESGLL